MTIMWGRLGYTPLIVLFERGYTDNGWHRCWWSYVVLPKGRA